MFLILFISSSLFWWMFFSIYSSCSYNSSCCCSFSHCCYCSLFFPCLLFFQTRSFSFRFTISFLMAVAPFPPDLAHFVVRFVRLSLIVHFFIVVLFLLPDVIVFIVPLLVAFSSCSLLFLWLLFFFRSSVPLVIVSVVLSPLIDTPPTPSLPLSSSFFVLYGRLSGTTASTTCFTIFAHNPHFLYFCFSPNVMFYNLVHCVYCVWGRWVWLSSWYLWW